MRVLGVLAALLVGASAFQVVPYQSKVVGITNAKNTARYVTTMDDFERAVAGSKKAPNGLNKGVYDFNNFLVNGIYEVISFLFPIAGTERDFAHFYVLEVVARIPYFSYLTALHVRETLGVRDPEMTEKMRTHYAEADNELHHLLIMESLGGNERLFDRVVAQTVAFFYYFYVFLVYSFSEQAAYHLSEIIEDHAFNTYSKYLVDHEEMLKEMPVPDIARKYYIDDDPFLHNTCNTVKDKDALGRIVTRRPKLKTLYDVICNMRDDEKEHWETLCNLVQYDDLRGDNGKHPHASKAA